MENSVAIQINENPHSVTIETNEADGLGHGTKEIVQDQDIIASIATVFRTQLPIKAVTWDLVKSVTKNDEVSQKIIAMVLSVFPD